MQHIEKETGQPKEKFSKLKTTPTILGKFMPDLIFVTDITDYIRGEKSVMWRNFLSHTSFFPWQKLRNLSNRKQRHFQNQADPSPRPLS